MMNNLTLNEMAALKMVLNFIPLKDLLTAAMHHLADQEDTYSRDSADSCYKAISTFLN